MDAEAKPHAVVVPYPGQGHINPLMQLAFRLASSMGFYVTFVCTRGNHKSIVEAWAKRGILPPLEQGISIHLATIRDDVLPARNMRDILQFFMATKKLKEPFVELIEELVQSPPVSCIISDSILGWAQDVAATLKVPWIAYFPLPASSFLVYLNVPVLIADGKIPVDEDNLKEDDVLHVPGLPPLHPRDWPSFIPRNPGDPKFEDAIATVQRLKNADWVLLNSCDALEGAEILATQRLHGLKRFLPVGPLQPAGFLQDDASESNDTTGALWGEEHSCLEWLDKQPPHSVLYVSFGSIASISLAEIETLLQGLVNAKEAFLWVFRPDLVSDEEVWESLAERANKHGLVVRWAPQLKVLRHPSVGAFLTHCGWNSTFESICAGVPMICWPCFADQMLNCKYVVEVWEVGVRVIEEEPVSANEIERVIREMMRGEKGVVTRRKVGELRNACRKEFVESSTLKALVEGLRDESM